MRATDESCIEFDVLCVFFIACFNYYQWGYAMFISWHAHRQTLFYVIQGRNEANIVYCSPLFVYYNGSWLIPVKFWCYWPRHWHDVRILSLQMYLRNFSYYLNSNHLLLFRMHTTYIYLEAVNEWYPSLYNEIRDSELRAPTTLRHPNPSIRQFCCSHICVSSSPECSL
jgi:hypothetical protein